MATLTELLAEHTAVTGSAVEHLQRVVAECQLLSDLSFADFLLWVPVADGPGFLCVAQVRPTTGSTSYPEDMVGRRVGAAEWPLLAGSLDDGAIRRADAPVWHAGLPVHHEAVPVRHDGRVVAVLGRDANLAVPRVPSPLEIAYLGSAVDLCQMVADGSWPDASSASDVHTGPRAGDGLVRLDAAGTVVYASPNALSAYHRMGHAADLVGAALVPLTRALVPDPWDAAEVAQEVRGALGGATSRRIEADTRGGATVLFRALPLRPRGVAAGAIVLVRDITEVRRRDRALLSKDATIREIHHRVKNNLQTVAALLRLQSRRTASEEARRALQESVQRVSAIATVHETLSLSLDERVDLDEVIDKVLRVIGDVSVPDTRVRVRRRGSFGVLAAELATPLVMVLTELVQNALEHAFEPGRGGEVLLDAERDADVLDVRVTDDGRGLPDGFELARSDRLGLQIVRTLVDSELRGELAVRRGDPAGTVAELRVPLR